MRRIAALALVIVIFMTGIISVSAIADTNVPVGEISPQNASVRDIKKTHPKLLVNSYSEIEEKVKTDEYTLAQYQKIKKTADNAMKTPASDCTLTGYNLAKPMIDMIICYRVEKDRKYIDYIMGVLQKPRYYENVEINALQRGAELMALAFTYDWLYDVLSDDEKAHLLKCIKANLAAKRKAYDTNASWVVRQMNINQIAQSCIITAALAVSEEEPEISDWFMKNTVLNLSQRLGQYAPGGSFDEGPAYWVYVTQYLFTAFKCLETATGQTYGLAYAPGFDKTGDFYVQINGPTGLQDFRYGDTPADRRGYGVPGLFYLAEKYNNPKLGYWGKYFCSRYSDNRMANTAFSILLYNPDYCDYDPVNDELDGVFHGSGEVGSMRSSWEEENAVQVLYKGGGSIEGHSQLEAGGFTVDALGERWIEDLGWEDYGISDMFTAKLGRNNPRYKLYRNGSQGNNTFIINPSETTGQNPEHFAAISESRSGIDESYAVVDLTTAYDDYASKALRGFKLMDGKRYIIVQDEVELKKKGDYWWFAHTDNNLELSEDRRSIMMSSGSKRLLVKIISEDKNLKFMITEAKPLYFTPNHPDDSDNPGIKRITVSSLNTDKVNLAIAFIPIYDENTENETENMQYLPIEAWGNKFDDDAKAEGIYLDGKLIRNFRSDVTNYFISEKTGNITVKANENVKYSIDAYKGETGSTKIKVSEEGKNPTTYVITEMNVGKKTVPGIEVKNIRSSIGKNEQNLIDSNSVTYWDGPDEGTWFELDFGETVPLEAVLIGFKNGHLRNQYFDIEVSADGNTYTKVGEYISGGFTEKVELFSFSKTNGRYLKFVGHGNSVNNYSFVNEVYAFGSLSDARQALGNENGKGVDSLEVLCSGSSLILGEEISYRVKFLDSSMNEYKPSSVDITVINDGDSVKADEKAQTITAVNEGKTTLRFLANCEGHQLYKDVAFEVTPESLQKITAVEDSYIEAPAPENNRGKTEKLTVRGSADDAYSRMILMKFDISSVSDDMEKAWVYLYGSYKSDTDAPQLIGAYSISNNWSQSTVIFKNAPHIGEQISQFVLEEEPKWVKFDVTEYVKKKKAEGEKYASIELYQSVSAAAGNTVYSVESSYKPYIGFSIKKAPNVDEEKYTKHILTNPAEGIDIAESGILQFSEKFLTLAMKKSVPYIGIEKNEIRFAVNPNTLKKDLNGQSALFVFDAYASDTAGFSKTAALAIGSGKIIKTSISKNGKAVSDFYRYGNVELSFELDESYKGAKKIFVYFMADSSSELEEISSFKIDEANIITIRHNRPGIFAVKKG